MAPSEVAMRGLQRAMAASQLRSDDYNVVMARSEAAISIEGVILG